MHPLFKLVSALMIASLLSACQTTKQQPKYNPEEIKEQTGLYLKTYAFREDFEQFLSFYADNAVVEDVIRGEKMNGLAAIKDFFNWDDNEFSMANSVTHLVTQQITVNDNQAIIRGYFMPFEYAGVKLGPWRFITWLEFNDKLKISKQTDWINYTPKIIFNDSPNANSQLKIPNYYFLNSTKKSANSK